MRPIGPSANYILPMRFVIISDTHNKHRQLRTLPPGDAIIHAGDITSRGQEREVNDFLKWFSGLDYKYKIFIAGNHDFLFEQADASLLSSIIPDNITYLNDSGITIEGINIWGSPITPWFHDWAFNRQRGSEIMAHWKLIPADTDILITHGPVAGILDTTTTGIIAGCEDLAATVRSIKPAYFISGHIHEAYGQEIHEGTTYINAAVLDERYVLRNQPQTFDLKK